MTATMEHRLARLERQTPSPAIASFADILRELPDGDLDLLRDVYEAAVANDQSLEVAVSLLPPNERARVKRLFLSFGNDGRSGCEDLTDDEVDTELRTRGFNSPTPVATPAPLPTMENTHGQDR